MKTRVTWVRALGWCSLAWLVVVWIVLDGLGDRVWWTVALVFGPRWVLAAGWLGFVPWLATDARRAMIPALAGLAVALFAVMGIQLGLYRVGVAGGLPYRVLELNADGGTRQAPAILAELRSANADLIVIAECGPVLAGAIVRAVVDARSGPIRVGLVHLATPRNALDAYFSLSKLWLQGGSTRANMAQREEESLVARRWILAGPALPTVIAGDFNLPVESAIYDRYWGEFRNAFGRAGIGTGYTKHTRLWGCASITCSRRRKSELTALPSDPTWTRIISR